jgi:hypothetical protein
MHGFYNIHKSINVTGHIIRIKSKNHTIISIDTEKAFSITQHGKSSLKKLGIEGAHLNIVKAIHDKPIVSIILKGEKLKLFPLKSGMR